MAVGDGRNQVAPDTPTASQWGNAIADRTIQSYANTAERDSEWTAPQPGAACYTAAEDEYWIRHANAWKLLPLGYLGSAAGPAAYTKCGATLTTLAQYNFTAKNGRVYQMIARGAGTQRVKGGGGNSRFYLSDSFGTQWYDNMNNPQVGDILGTSGSYYFRATKDGAAWARLSAMTDVGGGGYVDFGANGCRVYVQDVGG